MMLSHGVEEYIDNKKKLIRYNFFQRRARTAAATRSSASTSPLMRLVNVLKSAAQGYGTERRVILLHGPVGSAKSTIARLLKKGIEEYSRTPEGALYTYYWTLPGALQRARRRQRDVPVADARGAAAPDPARVARRGDRRSSALGNDDHKVHDRRRRQPGVPARSSRS